MVWSLLIAGAVTLTKDPPTAASDKSTTFAFDPELGRPIVVTILGSTAEGRFEDAMKLVEATMEYINNQ